MTDRSLSDFVVYGGTRGIGLLISLKLASEGFKVFTLGRSASGVSEVNIEGVTVDFSNPSYFPENREFLSSQPNCKYFIFNIGGSFGIYDRSPKVKDFQLLVNLNVAYILDTVNFLESSGRLNGCLFVFMLTNAVQNGGGSLPYRMLKICLDEYAKELERVYAEQSVHVLRFYLPLILYPDRFMARKFLSLGSQSQRHQFIEKNLFGIHPIYPMAAADLIVSKVSTVLQHKL